jgi:hypothetical protein
MAHLECRRLGDLVSVSSEDDQATITDDGLVGWQVLSLGIDGPCVERSAHDAPRALRLSLWHHLDVNPKPSATNEHRRKTRETRSLGDGPPNMDFPPVSAISMSPSGVSL